MSTITNSVTNSVTTSETPEETKILCSLEVISSARKHADSLYVLRVLGYDVIVSRAVFGDIESLDSLVGVKGILFFVDAVIPHRLSTHPAFSFLSDSHMGKRVKTIKLRGEYSQGLFFTLDKAKEFFPEIKFDELPVGTNLTNLTGTMKYFAKEDNERPDRSQSNPLSLQERLLDVFPYEIPKTEQIHLQKQTHLLEDASERPFVVTLKVDGQSGTFFYDNKKKDMGMCSRNYKLLVDEAGENVHNPHFVFIEKKYRILEKLARFCQTSGRSLAIQGEIYGASGKSGNGSSINGNRLKLKEWRFAVFEIYEWDIVDPDTESDREEIKEIVEGEQRGRYLQHAEVVEICKELGIPHVPVIRECLLKELPQSIDEWMKMADSLTWDSLSPVKGLCAEGMVIKTTDGKLPYISCKVISRKYLAKFDL